MVLPFGQGLYLGIQDMKDSGNSLNLDQEGMIEVAIDRDLGTMIPGEKIGIVIDHGQHQGFQNKLILLGALGADVIPVVK